MSQELRATFITFVVLCILLLWVPFLALAQRCVRAVLTKRDRAGKCQPFDRRQLPLQARRGE